MGTFTSTFTASNGAQSNTLVHAFSVTQAAQYVGVTQVFMGSGNVTLPAGSVADDVLLLWAYGSSSRMSQPTGGATLLPYTSFNGSQYVALFTYTLTAADISNGYLAITVANASTYLQMIVFRGVDGATPADVVSALASGASTDPASVTVPSLNTNNVVEILVFLGVVRMVATTAGTFTYPAGFTSILDSPSSGVSLQSTSYKQQAAAGATGDMTLSFENGSAGTSGGIVVALKRSATGAQTVMTTAPTVSASDTTARISFRASGASA